MGVVSFTPRPLYSQGKIPRYPLDRRQSQKTGPINNKLYIGACYKISCNRTLEAIAPDFACTI